MKNVTMFAVVLASICCCACTDNSGDEAEGHLLETQQKALERARDVEEDVAEAARRRAEEIDRAESGG